MTDEQFRIRDGRMYVHGLEVVDADKLSAAQASLMMAVAALSWAVGHIDGLGYGTDNYAARELERLSNPQIVVPPRNG